MAVSTWKRKDDQDIAKESNEILKEVDSAWQIESKEALEEASAKFKESQTYANLSKAIPSEIVFQESKNEIVTNVSLFDRICTNVENISISNSKFEWLFEEYVDEYFWWMKLEDIQDDTKDQIIQKLAVIAACNDWWIINLSVDDKKELTSLLLPLVNTEQIGLWDIEAKETEPHDAFEEHPAYPYLEQMVEQWVISQEDFDLIASLFEQNKSFDGIELTEHSETIQEIIAHFQWDKQARETKNTESFLTTFQDQDLDDLDTPYALTLIAKNYIPFVRRDWVQKFTEFNTAVEMTAKDLLYGITTINRSTIVFEEAIRNIYSKNYDREIAWIETLRKLRWMTDPRKPNEEIIQEDDAITKLLKKSERNARDWLYAKQEAAKKARRMEEQENKLQSWNTQQIASPNQKAANDDTYDVLNELDEVA